MPGLSPARQQKRHAFKLTYVSEITLVISNQCGLFGVLGAPPLGERVVSNEVRARERLLPFQASKEVPDWIRHDRGREKEVPAFAGKTEGGEFRHAFCGICLLLKHYRIITRR